MQASLFTDRVLCWFSCGAASLVASKLAIEKYQHRFPVEILYCDTLKYEHPDNERFLVDAGRYLGVPIKILKSPKYEDIFDVFRKERYIAGVAGARCTRALKREVRIAYQDPTDTHIFGYTADEKPRIRSFERDNDNLHCDWILEDQGISKSDCYRILREAGIELPTMYLLGYHNNNCIGCVKGGAGYWNKIRKDFPEAFLRMASFSRGMNVRLLKVKGERIFLDELPLGVGRYDEEPDFECGPQCVMPSYEEVAS